MKDHDPLCPQPAYDQECPRCALIARVRADERERHALVLAELREVIAVDFLAGVLEPCCDHDCAHGDEYDDDAPDDDAFICTQGHWRQTQTQPEEIR